MLRQAVATYVGNEEGNKYNDTIFPCIVNGVKILIWVTRSYISNKTRSSVVEPENFTNSTNQYIKIQPDSPAFIIDPAGNPIPILFEFFTLGTQMEEAFNQKFRKSIFQQLLSALVQQK